MTSSDVDVQMSNSSIRAHWFGFHHPHCDLTYSFGVGSRSGEVDVSNGYIIVGDKTDHEEFGLPLQYFKVSSTKHFQYSIKVFAGTK